MKTSDQLRGPVRPSLKRNHEGCRKLDKDMSFGACTFGQISLFNMVSLNDKTNFCMGIRGSFLANSAFKLLP